MTSHGFLAKVLLSIAPSTAELVEESAFAKRVVSRFSKFTRGKVRIMGSVAKGTFLKDSKDLDVFILLPHSVPIKKFESIAKSCAFRAFPKAKKEIGYAEHPYVRLFVEGRKIDLVPAYEIKSVKEKASSVDRSVLHLRYIEKNLRKTSRGEVLLLKKFLKSNGLYGAEIRIEGFSGYLCELLIIRYGLFSKTLRAISKWKMPVVIDILKYYPKPSLLLEKFKDTPLIVVDPVDRNRNVAAIITEENARRLISLAKAFSKKPSEKFFKNNDSEFFRKRLESFIESKAVYVVRFPRPTLVDDILWGQLKRFARSIQFNLKKLEFTADFLVDSTEKECSVFFHFKKAVLPDKIFLKGPPLKLKKHVAAFKKSHSSAKFISKSGHIFAISKRKYRDAIAGLNAVLKNPQVYPSHIPRSLKVKLQAKHT